MSATWDSKTLEATPVALDELLIIDISDGRNQHRSTLGSLQSIPWTVNQDANNNALNSVQTIGLQDTSGVGTVTFTPNSGQTGNHRMDIPNLDDNAEIIFDNQVQSMSDKTLNLPILAGLVTHTQPNATQTYLFNANHTVPAAAQVIANIQFNDDDDIGANRLYSQISSEIDDPTNTSIDGSLHFSAAVANVLTEVMKIDANGLTLTGDLQAIGGGFWNIEKGIATQGDFEVGNTTEPGFLQIKGDASSVPGILALEAIDETFVYLSAEAQTSGDLTVLVPSIEQDDVMVVETQAATLENKTITNAGPINVHIANTTGVLELEADHNIPAPTNVIGQVDFIDDDDNSVPARRTYAQITSQVQDPAAGSLDGSLHFSAAVANVLTEVMKIDANGLTLTGDLQAIGGGFWNIEKGIATQGDFEVGNTTEPGFLQIKGDASSVPGILALEAIDETFVYLSAEAQTSGDLTVLVPSIQQDDIMAVLTEAQTLEAKTLDTLTMVDATDITFGTTTGTKIGTGTTQKIGFFNATPVVQPVHIADATDAASAISQLNLLLAQFAALGLQASS